MEAQRCAGRKEIDRAKHFKSVPVLFVVLMGQFVVA